jgi:hypothetical protein
MYKPYTKSIRSTRIAARRTVEVASQLKWANTQLARTDEYADISFKRGISSMIESVLHCSGNYSGFGFNNLDDSELDTPGYWNRFYYFNDAIRSL